MADLVARPSHYALLIGIDAYPNENKGGGYGGDNEEDLEYKSMKGCVRDVHSIKQHLDNKTKSVVQMYVLTASLATNTTTTSRRLAEEPGMWPTHENVVNTIKKISHDAKEGDFVYVHFSGHGTAIRNPRRGSPVIGKQTYAFSNPSTGDLALVLLQNDGRRPQYLHGGRLALLLKDLADRGLEVTLVLDCCFSGSVMRNDASVRWLEYDPRVDATLPGMSRQTVDTEDELKRPAYRGASLAPNWLVNPTGYTIIAACGPTETAKEIKTSNGFHGVLSYFLAETFREYKGVGGKLQYIQQILRAKVEHSRERYGLSQTPVCLGNKNLDFFGYDNPRIGPAPIPVVKCRDGTIRMDAGEAHGVCEGDTFTISAAMSDCLTASDIASVQNYCVAEVISVRPLTSLLQLSITKITGESTLAATALTRRALKKLPIWLQIECPWTEGWTKVLAEHNSLSICSAHGNEESSFSLKVTLSDHESYEIRNDLDQLLWTVQKSLVGPTEEARHVLKALEHLASFQMFQGLTNSSQSVNGFEESFSAQIIGPTGRPIGPGGSLDVENKAIVIVEVENKEARIGHNLYLHPYCMSSTWEIENVHDGNYAVIPPRFTNRNCDFETGASGTWRKKLRMEAPSAGKRKGQEPCKDVIKLFLTSRPTSFLSLELPELGEPVKRKQVNESRATSDPSIPEDWFTLSFHIRILT